MIIFIDASGNENVIRNDNIAVDLFKRGSIKEETLVKTSIRGEWKKAKEIEIFQNLLEAKNIESNNDQEVEKENERIENTIDVKEDPIKEEIIKDDVIAPEEVATSDIVEENIETENNSNNEQISQYEVELKKTVPSASTRENVFNETNGASFKRIKPNNIKVLKFFLYALMLSSLVMLVADINLYNLLNQFNDPTYVPPSNIDTIADNADNYVSIASFINIGILIIAYFFGGRWIYKSNLNLQNISSNKLRFSPGWSVGWYFIPIFSIWKPYQAMKEIYLTSQRIANPNKSPILPGSFIIWWLLWLIGNYLGWYYFRQSLTIDSMSLQEIINLSLIAIVFDIIDVITIFMFLNIVKNINHFEQKIFN